MNKCPKCNSENIVAIQYGYGGDQEHYDGVSEYQCQDCKYRQGRWTQEELKDGYIESVFGERGHVKTIKTN